MFTGIIEEIGIIDRMNKSGDAIVIAIKANKILNDVQLGDSVAVNGVCLTVTSFNKDQFTVDVMPETVYATTLKNLNKGSKVNLERAMAANGRFGGHFVSGHVDGIGKIVNKKAVSNAVYYEIEVPEELSRFIIFKGSVTVDGTSLTVFETTLNSFTISLIPHTRQETVLGFKEIGDIVNVECDMLAKYLEHFINRRKESSSKVQTITEGFLKEHGYL